MTNPNLPNSAHSHTATAGAEARARSQGVTPEPVLPEDARGLLEKARHFVDEADSFTQQAMRGPASMNVRAAERELMTLFTTFRDISADHPTLLTISDRIAVVKSVLASAPVTPVPSIRSHVPKSQPAQAPAAAPDAPCENSLRAAIPPLRSALLKAQDAYQKASRQATRALKHLPPNGSTQHLEGLLRETRRSQQSALLLVKTLRDNYPNLHGMLENAPDAVVLIRLIQLIEETDARWTRTERAELEERAAGARTVRETAQRFQREARSRSGVTAVEQQLEYLQWYCDLLSLLQPKIPTATTSFHASAIDAASEVAAHRVFIDDTRAAL